MASMMETLTTLRMNGWMVAVHNDYMLNGQAMTFWLFTHPKTGRFIKGEGKTDAEALEQCAAAALRLSLPAHAGGIVAREEEFAHLDRCLKAPKKPSATILQGAALLRRY